MHAWKSTSRRRRDYYILYGRANVETVAGHQQSVRIVLPAVTIVTWIDGRRLRNAKKGTRSGRDELRKSRTVITIVRKNRGHILVMTAGRHVRSPSYFYY